jgi:hypothetical protein
MLSEIDVLPTVPHHRNQHENGDDVAKHPDPALRTIAEQVEDDGHADVVVATLNRRRTEHC